MNLLRTTLNFFRRLQDVFTEPKLAIFGNKMPYADENTFIVWEPCSKSHAEVVPGYAKHLLDLGYNVSVVVNPKFIREGLFSRFKNPRLHINAIPRGAAKAIFSSRGLGKALGIMVTTAGKLASQRNFEAERAFFREDFRKKKILFVEHKLNLAFDSGHFEPDLITLRQMDYKSAPSIPVNPNYFGEIRNHEKNSDIIKFVTVGSLQEHRRNNSTILNAAEKLVNRGIKNFRIIIIGKGNLHGVPKVLEKHIELSGTLPFARMFDKIEESDFFLTAYELPKHSRYITSGTSGSFQLIYGFLKPCIINSDFAAINKFDTENSIIYRTSEEYADAMERAIKMDSKSYAEMRSALSETVSQINAESLSNLRNAIHKNEQR